MTSYIWVNRWDEFQTFQTKRNKPWAPPWIKLYPRLLDDSAFIDLTPNRRLILLELFMLFSRTRGDVAMNTRRLSESLAMRVTTPDIEALNHAGFIDICSGTVLEQRRNAFWNRSTLEVEVEVEVEKPLPPSVVRGEEGWTEEVEHGETDEPDPRFVVPELLKEIPW